MIPNLVVTTRNRVAKVFIVDRESHYIIEIYGKTRTVFDIGEQISLF